MGQAKKIFTFLIFSALFLGFYQNCSKVRFKNPGPPQNKHHTGNGEGYLGKLVVAKYIFNINEIFRSLQLYNAIFNMFT